MVPRLHKRGRSFKGCATYLLHDKDADTQDRVAWAETRNLATDDPQLGWRLMAATAMDQARLKEQAGIKNTGRKSGLHVQHFSLSWHKDDNHDLDRQAMLGAAEAAIAALGASDRQAIIVCHNDEPHPHVHIMLNRVSPEDGRMLSSSKEKLKLSEWAERYEKERGRIWCDERVINNAARKRGEYTRGTPAKARNIYEAELQRPGNDNPNDKTRDAQRQKDAALARKGREQKQRQAQAWAKLEQDHKQRINEIKQATVRAAQRDQNQVREDFRPRWAELHHGQQADMKAFEHRETTLFGRIQNRFKSIDLGRIIGGKDKGQAIGEAFGAMTSQAGRLDAEKKKQREQEERLQAEQKRSEDAIAKRHRQDEQQRLEANRQKYQAQRMQLVLSQQMDKAKLRAEWSKRNQDRKEAFRQEGRQAQVKPPLQPPKRQEPQHAPPPRPKTAEQDNTPPKPTQASDLLPKDAASQRAQQIDDFKKRMQERAMRQRKDRDHGDRDR